ncbi:hypothetical protein HDU96_005878 [Phlyctochytrium bullatum]|nr:hypothetical protein HDU96_005878 [Phlyctochytrium bullatum]
MPSLQSFTILLLLLVATLLPISILASPLADSLARRADPAPTTTASADASLVSSGVSSRRRPKPSPGQLRKFELNITETYTGIADCVERTSVIYVNGQFPPPEIRIKAGDTLEITVRNHLLTSPVSIHLHGLDQRGSPFSDGASRVSQDPILPGDSFIIKTETRPDQAGTYFYHAHYALLTLDGPLIIEANDGDLGRQAAALGYEDERTLVLSDHWHASADAQIQGLVSSPVFKWIGNAQSLLTNGRSVFPTCTPVSATNTSALYPAAYEVVNVEANKVYRLRLIGAMTLHQVHFHIPNHTLTIIEQDGTYLVPTRVRYLSIAPGQRFSVLVRTDQPPADYWMNTQYRWRGPPGATNGQSILRYAGGAPTDRVVIDTPTELDPDALEWGKTLRPNLELRAAVFPRGAPTREIVMEGKQTRVDGFLRWAINNVAYEFPRDKPLLAYAYLGEVEKVQAMPRSKMYEVQAGDVIDIVIQNTAALNGVCEVHPWHLHGHTFWDLGGGPGKYEPFATPADGKDVYYPQEEPVMRDTVVVYPYTGAPQRNQSVIPAGEACGWKKIRFVADNPGVWPFHCHVASHMVLGMMTVFAEAVDKLPRAPRDITTAFKNPF